MQSKKWTSKIVSLILAVTMLVGTMAISISAPDAEYGVTASAASFPGDDGSVKLNAVNMQCVAAGGREFIGFCEASEAPSTNGLLRNPDNFTNAGKQTLKPNTQYVIYLTKCPPWYFNTSVEIQANGDTCALISVNANGSVTIEGCTFDWNSPKVNSTVNYKITPDSPHGGFQINYAPNSGVQTILAKDMVNTGGEKPYGAGVSDSTLESWAKFGINVGAGRGKTGKLPDGGDRQGFNVNYLEDMVVLVGTPARTKSKMFDAATLQYYRDEKAKNDEFMKHYTYANSEYYLHDVYCQGVWDTMPAVYGWEQDEHTEPGLLVKKAYPEVTGLAYGFAGGGQNPWVLCDYIERHAGYYDASTKQKVEGTMAGAGWYKGYDETAKVPYLWHPGEGIFLAYENFESLTERCRYINESGVAGCIIWELSGDNTNTYPMISLMDKTLNPDKRILGYFTNWSVYNKFHQNQTPKDLPLDKLDVVNYSFFQVGGQYERGEDHAPENCLNSMDRWADDYTGVDATMKGAPNMLLEFEELKRQYPDFKLLISVGGWTRGDGFNAMVNNPANRTTFVNSVKEFMNKYPWFDGIDLDWEYAGSDRLPDFDDPNDLGSPGNKELNFSTYTALCKELRAMLEGFGNGRNYLTACSPAAPSNAIKQDLRAVANECTFINIMTYDYHGAFDPTIGYNSPLYAYVEDENPNEKSEWSTNNSVNFYKSMGVPLSKINIGTPFYSRGWAGVKADQDGNPRPLPDPTPIFPPTPVEAQSIIVTPETANMTVGEQITAKAEVLPEKTTDKSVTWSSSNSSIARVDSNGVITAVAPGTAVITATTKNGLSDTCIVTVKAATVYPSRIEVIPETAELEIGKTITAKAIVTPDNATDKTVTWSSSNSSIATVNSNGVITAVREGVAVITARTSNGLTDTCIVTVNPKTYTVYKINGDKAYCSYYGLADCSQMITMVDSKTYIPVRLASVATGIKTVYDEPTDTITMYCNDECNVRFTIGNPNVEFLDAKTGAVVWTYNAGSDSARYIDGKAYLPIRTMAVVTGIDMYYSQDAYGEYVIFASTTMSKAEIAAATAIAGPAIAIHRGY